MRCLYKHLKKYEKSLTQSMFSAKIYCGRWKQDCNEARLVSHLFSEGWLLYDWKSVYLIALCFLQICIITFPVFFFFFFFVFCTEVNSCYLDKDVIVKQINYLHTQAESHNNCWFLTTMGYVLETRIIYYILISTRHMTSMRLVN